MTRLILILALLLAAAPALAQRNLTDAFGRTVTVSKDGVSYAVEGIVVQPKVPGDDAAALNTLNGLAPPGWQPPAAPLPPDTAAPSASAVPCNCPAPLK